MTRRVTPGDNHAAKGSPAYDQHVSKRPKARVVAYGASPKSAHPRKQGSPGRAPTVFGQPARGMVKGYVKVR